MIFILSILQCAHQIINHQKSIHSNRTTGQLTSRSIFSVKCILTSKVLQSVLQIVTIQAWSTNLIVKHGN